MIRVPGKPKGKLLSSIGALKMPQNQSEILFANLLAIVSAAVALLVALLGLVTHRRSRTARHRRVSRDRRSVCHTWQQNAAKVADLIENGKYHKLVKMVKDGLADPNQRHGKMSSPMLVDAVGKGETELALTLIAHPSIDCNLSREDSTTPLIMAASRGHHMLVEKLLQWPWGRLDLNARNSNRSTALIVSARPGHATIVRMLLDAGADRTCAQYIGFTALHFACREGHLEIVQSLLDCPEEVVRQMLQAQDRHGFSPLMYSCQRDNHKVVKLILDKTDTLFSKRSPHGTALHVAATHNSCKAMKLLLNSGKLNPNETDSRGRTACEVAKVRGNSNCERMIIRAERSHLYPNEAPCSDDNKTFQFDLNPNEQTVEMSTEEFSTQLHSRMLACGFSSQRAQFQAGEADLLAELGNTSELRKRFDKRKTSGSFSDGWGSSSQRLNGSVAPSSDVDMSVQQKNFVHVEGSCSGQGECQGAKTCSLENGFLRQTNACGDKPSKTDLPAGVRPSMDFCSYWPCCCCPRELQKSLSKLPARFQLPDNPEVEVVRSVRPECADQMEMRISCTSLEKEILRQLSTCEGQVFVIVKYIFKHVLAASGLKSYHSKTLMFFLVCEIPESEWRADNLESLVTKALLRFERFVIESRAHGAANCMPHFFIPDAWVYFKTDTEVDRSEILRCLQAARLDLRSIMGHYMDKHLRPLRQSQESPFVFYPFSLVELVTPFTRPEIPESGRLTRYQDIYPMVFKILADIGDPECSGSSCEKLSGDIDSLPDSASTARAVLKVLMHLKLGTHRLSLSAAQQVLISSESIRGKRSIDFRRCQSVEDAKRCVLHQLESSNSAWKFCFYFNSMLDFEFLPDLVKSKLGGPTCGLYQLPGYLLLDFAYFVNFDAVLKVLRLCLAPPDRSVELVAQWYSELCSAEDADDIHELYLFAKFANHPEQLKHCLHRMESLSVKLDEELDMISEVQDRLAAVQF